MTNTRQRLRWALTLALPLLVLMVGCTSDAPAVISGDSTGTPTAEAAAPTETPAQTPTNTAAETPVENPTPTVLASTTEPAMCEDVPTFQSADTVSIACSAGFAVSPELFASNAGWHLFEAQAKEWVEIDYARTCCEPDDPTFTELLERNGVDAAAIAAFCADSGLANDSFSGCVNSGQGDEDQVSFDGTWLRVNGLGEHDFATSDQVVLRSIEQVFGAPDSVTEASECGAGPMTIASFDDFTVQFQDGVLIGWYYESSTPQLTTPSGVMVGLSEADLVVVYQGVEIRNDTLGREFFFEVPAGFMGGFISETNATVTALFAGTNCFFR